MLAESVLQGRKDEVVVDLRVVAVVRWVQHRDGRIKGLGGLLVHLARITAVKERHTALVRDSLPKVGLEVAMLLARGLVNKGGPASP